MLSRNLFSFWIIFISTSFSFADLRQQIQVQQNSQALHFTIQIENSEASEILLQLSNKATQVTTIQSPVQNPIQQTQNFYSIRIAAKSFDTIDYFIPVNPTENYAISSEDLWVPAPQTQGNVDQVFQFQAQPLAGYNFIDSAIGYPQDDFAFVLCKCHQYTSQDQRLKIYLLQDEPALAQKLLGQLEIYLQKYEADYGPYPYADFSVVESEKEVGYAFPKMTWIGNQLLHFPFILKTSLPHELLHSWWGNGVFVDYDKGNWCEGMTSLGSDYEFLNDADRKIYRLKAISSYLDYAQTSQEIPLSKFISRGEDRSLQAIGYDKSLMVLLMLQHKVGEKIFKQAQKEFYGKYRFQKASYEDFFSILSQLSGLDLKGFQNFWLYSIGILPEDFIQFQWNENQKSLQAIGRQSELAKIPNLEIQSLFQFQNQTSTDVRIQILADGQSLQINSWPLPEKPISYNFDPDFFLFRKLNENEKPVTFSQFLGAQQISVASDSPQFMSLAQGIFPDANLTPEQDFHFENPHLLLLDLTSAKIPQAILTALTNKNIQLAADTFSYQGKKYSWQDHSLFLSLRIQKTTLLLLRLGQTLTPQRWLQRFTHYGSKSYLILNTTAADEQGLWLEAYSRPL